MPVVAALFKDLEAAENAAAELRAIGVADDDISIISNQSGHLTTDADPVETTTAGAGIGAAGGGAIGLVASLVMTPIAGIGVVGILGWLATALAGASVGVVAGATVAGVFDVLRTSGSSEEEAHFFTEGLRAGATLVAVREPIEPDKVARILQRSGGGMGTSFAED
ncbi:hypothetical protein ASD54_21545 [Rhizobium sp. Root149]|uniref:hypothetical protein n=1 Tax=Rhizobium sp. Root149 TaxID=1736473 RepID=UPI0007134434|nr:hypothetical protein [Rhizobium sp. Root149]KQZ46609.1 hypothetical protein ASD54_21545 [Rhizobium sp. Root149]